jgi:hypothetical protein
MKKGRSMKKKLGPSFGFLAALVLLAGTRAFSAAPLKLKVMAELANIRLKPSISSAIIRQIPEGAILESIRKEGEFYLVKLEPDESGAVSGYVHESLVLPLGETPITERKPQIVEVPVKKNIEQPQRTDVVVQETPPEETGGEPPSWLWAVTLSAGANYALGGDLNAGAQTLADYKGTQFGAPGDIKVTPARLSYIFGGEVAIYVSQHIHLTAGVDFFNTAKNSTVSYSLGTAAATFMTKPQFQAVPVKLAIVLYPTDSFYFKLGVAFYFARCGYYYRYQNEDFFQEWRGDATAQGLGWIGGLGYEWAVADNISFVLEALGQYAPLKAFEGTGTYLVTGKSDPVTEVGKLYAYDYREPGKPVSSFLFILGQKPSDAYIENVREATVDFSGVSLRFGVKIKF